MLAAAASAQAGAGCSSPRTDSTPSSQQRANDTIRQAKREAAQTSIQAQHKAAEVVQEAVKEAADATRAASDAVAEANRKARGESAQAQANANVEVRKENRKTARETSDLRQWSQKKMDDLDNAIDAARAKEQTAAAKFHPDFEEGMKAVEVRRDVLRADVGSIETQSAQDMADFKVRLDKENSSLKERVSELSAAL
jgi:hypothetical protein